MPAQTEIRGWLGSYQQMADYAGHSPRTIARWIAEGKLKVRHLGKRKVVCLPKHIDQCIESLADRYEMEAAR